MAAGVGAVVAHYASRPSQWGVDDCFCFLHDCVAAQNQMVSISRPRLMMTRTEKEFLRQLVAMQDVATWACQLFDHSPDFKRVAPGVVREGDFGLVRGGRLMTGDRREGRLVYPGVVIGAGIVTRTSDGVATRPISDITNAWSLCA